MLDYTQASFHGKRTGLLHNIDIICQNKQLISTQWTRHYTKHKYTD